MLGTVEFYDRFKSHGMILAGGRTYWVHKKELVGIRMLTTGQTVEFDPVAHPRGPRARRVHLAEASAPRPTEPPR
jgi:cold shock CspA family protein